MIYKPIVLWKTLRGNFSLILFPTSTLALCSHVVRRGLHCSSYRNICSLEGEEWELVWVVNWIQSFSHIKGNSTNLISVPIHTIVEESLFSSPSTFLFPGCSFQSLVFPPVHTAWFPGILSLHWSVGLNKRKQQAHPDYKRQTLTCLSSQKKSKNNTKSY